MVLIPKREEFNEAERARLWWGREDYSCFRQVLIDWKRRNAHRISHSDNILSIDLTDVDDDEQDLHKQKEERANAEAIARTDAAKVAAAKAAAVTAAAAAAAATAAEVAACNAREEARAALKAIGTAAVVAAAAAAATGGGGNLWRDPMRDINKNTAGESIEVAAVAAAAASKTELDEAGRMHDQGRQQAEGGKDEGARTRPAHSSQVAAAASFSSFVTTAPAALGNGVVSVSDRGSEDGGLSDISEEEALEVDPGVALGGGGGRKALREGSRSYGSFNLGGGWVGAAAGLDSENPEDWSLNNPGDGMMPLRRANTTHEATSPLMLSSYPSPSEVAAVRLKAVPLSQMQAAVESLRAWRASLDSRLTHAQFVCEFEECGHDRERSVSLQHHHKPGRMGRATAKLMEGEQCDEGKEEATVSDGLENAEVRCNDTGTVAPSAAGVGNGRDKIPAGGGGSGGSGGQQDVNGGCAWAEAERNGQSRGESEERGAPHDDAPPAETLARSSSAKHVTKATATTTSNVNTTPVMVAFERKRKEALARRAEADAEQAAKAAAMVKAAAAAATTSAVATTATAVVVPRAMEKPAGSFKMNDSRSESLHCAQIAPGRCGGGCGGDEISDCPIAADQAGQVIQLGLNDSPGSAAAATAAGIRMAAEGVSNLSLRARDSVENLQEMAEEHSRWGQQVPLSSSA